MSVNRWIKSREEAEKLGVKSSWMTKEEAEKRGIKDSLWNQKTKD